MKRKKKKKKEEKQKWAVQAGSYQAWGSAGRRKGRPTWSEYRNHGNSYLTLYVSDDIGPAHYHFFLQVFFLLVLGIF
jgi:hypothetical protein